MAVHLMKERKGDVLTTACGETITLKSGQMAAVTIWESHVSCTDCRPKRDVAPCETLFT